MDGLECSEIQLTDLNLGDRIDAEYFLKEYLNIQKKLGIKKVKKIGDISVAVASAFYPAATQLYSVGDVAFVRCVDCINYPVISKEQNERFEKIPKSFIINNKGISILKKKEIVITKVGTPCYTSIVDDYEEVALSRTVLGLVNIKDVNPFYLMCFLRCKYGFEQLYRQRELTIQYQLTLSRVKDINVFIPSNEFQLKIDSIIQKHQKFKRDSIIKYKEAELILTKYIRIDFDKFNNTGISSKTLKDSYLRTGRIDAEYYQVKYDELITKLKSLNSYKLSTDEGICTFKKSIEPGSDYYQDEGIPFIRVSDISKFGIQESEIKLPFDVDDNIERLYPKKDTILFSKDGSIGIAYKVDKDLKVITSGALLHLSIKDINKVLPEYLTLVLNSRIVQMQAERDSNGAIIQHWRIDEISNVLIPVAPMEIQTDIKHKINESFKLRKESEELIKKGIRAVEISIEKSEEAAIEFLESGS